MFCAANSKVSKKFPHKVTIGIKNSNRGAVVDCTTTMYILNSCQVKTRLQFFAVSLCTDDLK